MPNALIESIGRMQFSARTKLILSGFVNVTPEWIAMYVHTAKYVHGLYKKRMMLTNC